MIPGLSGEGGEREAKAQIIEDMGMETEARDRQTDRQRGSRWSLEAGEAGMSIDPQRLQKEHSVACPLGTLDILTRKE